MRISVYIATSLDGFIARENGDIDWLPEPGDPMLDPGEDYGYGEFMSDVDVLLMGRNTFDKVLSFGVGWPYGDACGVILTNRPLAFPEEYSHLMETMAGEPGEIKQALSARGFKHAYIDGGVTIQAFMQAGLVDQLILTKIPILIGSGIPLFGEIPADVKLNHIKTIGYKNGMVQSHYTLPS